MQVKFIFFCIVNLYFKTFIVISYVLGVLQMPRLFYSEEKNTMLHTFCKIHEKGFVIFWHETYGNKIEKALINKKLYIARFI